MIARAPIALLAGAIALVPACATVPSQFSARSAASPQAVEGPRASIGIALREDPPLPGASTEGWVGLAAPSGGGMPMGHMHHPGMHMQGMEGMDMQGMEGMDMGPSAAPPTDAGATDAGTASSPHAH